MVTKDAREQLGTWVAARLTQLRETIAHAKASRNDNDWFSSMPPDTLGGWETEVAHLESVQTLLDEIDDLHSEAEEQHNALNMQSAEIDRLARRVEVGERLANLTRRLLQVKGADPRSEHAPTIGVGKRHPDCPCWRCKLGFGIDDALAAFDASREREDG